MSTASFHPAHEHALRHVAGMSAGPPIDPWLRVTVNLHPDRPTLDGLLVIQALARDGIYRSQFVTGTSNGGLAAHPGGNRWLWEQRLFGGAYDDRPAELRPIYGTLNFQADPTGGAPRFGSAHLRLHATVLTRTTFCYPDSVFSPTLFGVANRIELIALAEGHRPDDPLDDYIEAHVHGPVRLDRDVDAMVLDPSHNGTAVETAAQQLGCRTSNASGTCSPGSAARQATWPVTKRPVLNRDPPDPSTPPREHAS